MNNLTRWNPYREMLAWRDAMDRMFDLNSPALWNRSTEWGVALDVSESDDEYVIKASLPGINPNDLEITFDSNILSIKGETKTEEEVEERHYHLRERRFGSFCRSFSLPSSVNADAIEATYEAGVLTLHLPKTEEAKPRRIAVKSVGSPQLIEGRAADITGKN